MPGRRPVRALVARVARAAFARGLFFAALLIASAPAIAGDAIKVIAKGNDGTIFDDDDFFLHIMMDTPLDVAQATLTANTYCR